MRVTVVATGFDNKAADSLRSTLGTAAPGTDPGETASAPSAVFSAEVNTPSAASRNASAAKPVEEENSDTSYYDCLLYTSSLSSSPWTALPARSCSATSRSRAEKYRPSKTAVQRSFLLPIFTPR